MTHALKSGLVQLLRSGVPQLAAYQEKITSALGALGQQEAAESAVRQLERASKRAVVERCGILHDTRMRAERVTELSGCSSARGATRDAPNGDDKPLEPPPKRACVERPPAPADAADAAPSTDAGLLLQVASALGALAAGGDLATLNSFVAQLTPAVLADVVLLNMRHLPAAPPAAGSAAMETAAPSLASLLGGAVAPVSSAAAAGGPAAHAHDAAAPAGARAAVAQPPAPLVAQQLGGEQRAQQRLAAAERILQADDRRIVTGAGHLGICGAPYGCMLTAAHGPPVQPLAGEHFSVQCLHGLGPVQVCLFMRNCWTMCCRTTRGGRCVAAPGARHRIQAEQRSHRRRAILTSCSGSTACMLRI
jgi:hypothetical protein